jgi:fibronectin type 3 domain-containing protein
MQYRPAIAPQIFPGVFTTKSRRHEEKKPWCLGALVVAFLLSIVGYSQQADIYVRSFHAGDSVMLRWIPSSYATWQQGNTNGYRITRFGLDEYLDLSGQDLTGKGIVIAENVKPLPKNDTMWMHLQKTQPSSQFVYSSLFALAKAQPDAKKRVQQESITYGFSLKVCDDNPDVAKAAGLFFTDRTARKGEKYIYRVEIINTKSSGVASADEKLSVLHAVQKPSGQFRNRSMRLTFDVAQTREEYSGYIIERSEDSIHFERINTTLLSFVRSQYEEEKHELVYEDSIPKNGKLYWYRVRGYSYFGLTGPPSAIVRGKGKEEWNAYPMPDTCFSPDNKKVVMEWSLPVITGEATLKGVCILRSDKVDGKYISVSNSVAGNSFTDTSAKFTNYYMLAAISSEGDTAFSFPFLAQLQDNTPPAIPENIIGVIDTNGIVHLSWTTVKDDALKGYRVFRCNTLKEEFVEVSDSVIGTTAFTDTITLQTLTRDVYYSVRAVDHVWNNSDFSKPALLKRPDKIAPVSPLVKAIYHTDSTVVLRWINSSSDDIASKKLIRTSSSGKTELKVFSGKDSVSTFVDATAEAGVTYEYSLVVRDSSGNESALKFPAMNFSPRVRPALKNFTATPDLEKRIIALKWDLPSAPVDRVIIYKGKEGEAVRMFKTLSGTSTGYTDNQLYPGNVYTYRVKVYMKDGSESRISEVKVVF